MHIRSEASISEFRIGNDFGREETEDKKGGDEAAPSGLTGPDTSQRLVAIVVAVMFVTVAPAPVVILIRAAASVEVFVMPVSIPLPLRVIDNLTMIPVVVVVIFRVVDTDARRASSHKKQAEKSSRHRNRANAFVEFAHGVRHPCPGRAPVTLLYAPDSTKAP